MILVLAHIFADPPFGDCKIRDFGRTELALCQVPGVAMEDQHGEKGPIPTVP